MDGSHGVCWFIYDEAVSIHEVDCLSDFLHQPTEEESQTETAEVPCGNEVIEDEERFSSARSSFSSDSSTKMDHLNSEFPPEIDISKYTKPGVSSPSQSKQSDSSCLVYFTKVKEDSGIIFQFVVLSNKRSTYVGWFYSLSPISGVGYCFHSDGSFYIGEFYNGKKNGFGQFYYDNGSHYDGFWQNDHKQGEGSFFFNKGLYYSGKWNENTMVDCKLEFSSSQDDDRNGIYSCIGTHNDYIFFKQAQINRLLMELMIDRFGCD